MNIYYLKSDCNKYQNLTTIHAGDWNVLREFLGTPMKSSWRPISVEVIFQNAADQKRPKSDFPYLTSHVPVFSDRATECLRPFIDRYGEFLELHSDEDAYVAYNVTNVIDVLDTHLSDIAYFKDSNRIKFIKKYCFHEQKLKDQMIFKVPQSAITHVFVIDKFVDLINKFNLTGFIFQKI